MKLLVHNFLSSKFLKGVVTGYPLLIKDATVEVKESEFNPEFIKRMLPKIDYPALRGAAVAVGHAMDLPDAIPAQDAMDTIDEDLLRHIHHALLCVEITEGTLECPEIHRQFKITNGIPNMLANEDEVAND